MVVNYTDKACSRGTGRRKSAVARVRLFVGNGKFTVNGVSVDSYFRVKELCMVASSPFAVFDNKGKFDVCCQVSGGGLSGQAGAVRHGISRALNSLNESIYHAKLKAAGFLTRDPRMKERKKYGLKAARKRPQFSKR